MTAAIALSQLAASGERARTAVRRALEGLAAADRKKLLHLATEAPPPGGGGEEADPGRRAALLLAGVLGGREAARAALSGLEHDTLAGEAEAALLWIGVDAIEPLVEQLTVGSSARPAVLGVLGRLLRGSPAHPAAEHLVSALSASEPQVARAALLALSEVRDVRCLGACERWLTLSAPPGLRKAAEQALSLVADNFREETLTLARAAAQRETGALLVACVITLLGGPVLGDLDQDLEYLARELNSESAVVRRAVAEALGSVRSARSVDIVVFALTDEEPEVQLAAVRALGRARSPEGQPLGVERLLELIERSPDEIVVAAALPALGETQDPRAAAALRPLARSASALVAVSAVEALGGLARELGPRAGQALSGLIEALSHPEPEVVKAAASALSEHPDPRVVTHLGACLDHEAWDVRRLAADLIGRRGGPGTIELLTARHALETDRSVREAVARALTRLASASGRFTTSPPPRSEHA
ncbi:MAG: HEAT repeat domain-containing protein [Polyangiaceae bacterium]|nr:HEAT repeat domain-containing protein [Polyangiaceae bacterium]